MLLRLTSPQSILFASLFACGSGGDSVSASASSSNPALERGLATVDIEDLRKDLTLLAGDDFRGRNTPSPELERAARYLSSRADEMGLLPGAVDEAGQTTFLYTYPLDWAQVDSESSKITFAGERGTGELAFGGDYYLYRSRELFECTPSGAITFVGGASSSDLGELDLSGRWALAHERTTLSGRSRDRVQASGAIGLIITPGPEFKGRAYAERFGRSAKTMKTGTGGPGKAPELGGVPDAPFPTVYLTEESAASVLAAAGMTADHVLQVGDTIAVDVKEVRRLAQAGGRSQLENVCALVPGTDAALAKEVIIVSAHYDHVGAQGDRIFNGADDNASGTCGLLAIAKALKAMGGLRRTVLLLWVSGEEKGLWGSAAWARVPQLPDGHYPVANINMDMIGRNKPDDLTATPSPAMGEEYNQLGRMASELAGLEGFEKLRSADKYWERSDHVNFARHLELPVCFLFADIHEDYHKPSDTAEKIDYDKMRRVVRLVVRMLDGLQEDELKLSSRETPSYEQYIAKARAERARRDMEEIGRVLESWAMANGSVWPESLAALTTADGDERPIWGESLPKDPWGAAYLYESKDGKVQLTSLGSDGAQGGEDEAADVLVGSIR
ncbi:MAG: hypothetical protein ACI841_001608 [Planctomycetota bacterium]|jgi:hypothetical protein